MRKRDFRSKMILKVSPIEEITNEEYLNRNCNKDIKIKCEDGELYYKPYETNYKENKTNNNYKEVYKK